MVPFAARLVVVHHVEVPPHHRVQGDFLEKLAVVAEGIDRQHLLPVAAGVRHRHLVSRHDDDLAERESHALAQLVLAVHRVLEELQLHLEQGVVVALALLIRVTRDVEAVCRRRGWVIRIDRVARGGFGELLVDPRKDPDLLDVIEQSFVRPPRRLCEHAPRFGS